MEPSRTKWNLLRFNSNIFGTQIFFSAGASKLAGKHGTKMICRKASVTHIDDLFDLSLLSCLESNFSFWYNQLPKFLLV